MKKIFTIFVLIIVIILSAFGVTSTNLNTHCSADRTDKLPVGQWVFYFMTKPKTHEQFLKDLQEKCEIYRKGELKLLGNYIGTHTPILTEDKYGLLLTYPSDLLSGKTPTIASAINKTDYFKNKLIYSNKVYKNGDFWIKGEYINNFTPILCENQYGLLEPLPTKLLRGQTPTIKCAVDQNAYFAAQGREVHGDKYGYELVDYKNSRINVQIYCRKHKKYFPQTPDRHIHGKTGCPDCGMESVKMKSGGWSYTEWENKAKKSKNFDSYKVYIIKLWNDTEIFYKIGKTFTTVKHRFSGCFNCNRIPYKYEILKIFINSAKEICELEDELKRIHKPYKYNPDKKFRGQNECFSKIEEKFLKNV